MVRAARLSEIAPGDGVPLYLDPGEQCRHLSAARAAFDPNQSSELGGTEVAITWPFRGACDPSGLVRRTAIQPHTEQLEQDRRVP